MLNKLSFLKLIAFLITTLWSSITFSANYTSITVFGDSMSDGGNDATAVTSFYKLYGDPFPTTGSIPHAPANNFRYSDGLVAVEYMAKNLGLYDTSTFFNHAVGGARAVNFAASVTNFIQDPSTVIDPTGLYVIEMGQVDISNNIATPDVISSGVIDGIQLLHEQGVQHFLVLNAALAGDAPSYKDLPESSKIAASNISLDFNHQLKSKINALPYSNDIVFFDLGTATHTLVSYATTFDFISRYHCITSFELGQFCSDPYDYVFWDTVHYTAHSHAIAGDLMSTQLNASSSLTVTLASPRNNATLQLGETVTLSAIAVDDNAAITSVAFYDNETLIETDTSFPYSYDWKDATAGAHTLKAVALNNQGDTTISSTLEVYIATDNTPPTVVLNPPIAYKPGNKEASMEATAADSDGSIAKVEFYYNNILYATDTTAPYIAGWDGAPDGTYSMTAKAYDDKGAVTTSAPVTVVINGSVGSGNTPPTVVLNPPIAYKPGNKEASMEATAADSDGTIAKVEFYYNNILYATDTTAPYIAGWDGAPDGTYTMTAKAYDDKGAVTTSAPVTVVINGSVGSGNTPPTVVLNPPIAYKPGNKEASMEATAADPDGTIAKVEFYYNNILYATDTTAPYIAGWDGAPDGTYSMTAKAYDDKGAVTTSAPVTVVINGAL